MRTEFEIQGKNEEVVGTIVIEGNWRSKTFREFYISILGLLALDMKAVIKSLSEKVNESE